MLVHADLQMVNMTLRILSKPSEEKLAWIFQVRGMPGMDTQC